MAGEQILRWTWRLYLKINLEVVNQKVIDQEGCIIAAEILLISELTIMGM
jgi:hypothetical protein